MQLQLKESLTIFIDGGTRSFHIPAGVLTDIPADFAAAAMVASASLTDPTPQVAAPAVEDPVSTKVPAIVEAMRTLLDRGDPAVLEPGGIPRIAEIDAIVGFRTNKADREAAWAVVEG